MNAAVSPNNKSSDLLFVHDAANQRKWLIDGGAVLSIMPPTLAQRTKGPTEAQLQAANGTRIQCYGVSLETITLADRQIQFPITLADVKQPILGADFLAHSYLAPNHRDGTLIDLKDHSVLKVQFDNESEPCRINFVDQATDPFYQLLDKFPNISNPSFRVKEVEHGVHHHIPTEGPPVQSRARKLSPEKLAVAKAEIEKLVELGVCQRGKSEWSSPLLVTTKPCSSPCTCEKQSPCGGWRVCGDYRRLNAMTTTDRYPVRNLQDFNNDLRGKKYFSKVDLLKGYHQIPVYKDDIKKTAVITPFGLFIFPRCPFGLKNAGQDFQRLMDQILGDIPHTFVYLDDILIASSTQEEHLEDLERVFKILEENGLVVNRKKCILGASSVEFLGHLVDADGIKPLPEKVETIRKTSPPTSIKELRRFLGMVNYYRRFVRAAAHHLYYLFDALKASPKRLNWSDDMQSSFEAIKDALANSTMLHHPDPNLPLSITTDASDVAMGAVIEQRGPQGWEPLAFWSKKLSDTQQNWCPYDRELNAAHKAIRHFKHMVEGRPFTLYTDHQSLVPSMHKKTDAPTARQTNQLSEIAEFTTDIRYLEGKSNFVADALSRPNGVLSNKAAAAVSNVSAATEERHVFLQHLDLVQNQSTISSVCFCQHLESCKKQPTISSVSQPDPFYDLDLRVENFYRDYCTERNPPETASAAESPTPRRKQVSFASPVASSDIRQRQAQMFSALKQELGDFLESPSVDASNCFSSLSSTNSSSETSQNGHVVAATSPGHNKIAKTTDNKDLVHQKLRHPSSTYQKAKNEALDEPLQPSILKQPLQNSQASTSNQGLSNATIRDLLAPSVPAPGLGKTEIRENSAAQWTKSEKNPEKLRNFFNKADPEATKVQGDSFRRAESNGAIPERVAAAVLEKNDVKAQNLPHSATKVDFSGKNSQKLPFLGDKESQDSENLQVDSSRRAEANGDVRKRAESTVAAIESKKVPEPKVSELQAVINAVDHYDINMEELAHQQTLDPDFRQLLRDARTGLQFRKIPLGDTFIFVDVSNGPARPFVPLNFRRRIFDVIHGLGHPGVQRTKQSVAAKFVWPGLNRDVAQWARECMACQRAKIHKHTVPPIQEFEVPHRRFAHVHADLVSMPVSNGCNHLLTLIDRFTRWPVAIPIKDIAADTIVDAFAHNWVSVYGVPEVITTDRGSQFTSQTWTQLMRTWGTKHITTTAYHPESNGMVERLHRRLKESLIALGQDERNDWYWKLPMTMLALRTTIKPDIGASPSELVYGEGIAVPGQLVGLPEMTDAELLRQQRASLSNVRLEVERLQPKPTSHHRRPAIHIPDDLSTASHVLVRRGLQPSLTAPYDGPFKVLARNRDGFRVQFPGRGPDTIALARLKPAFVSRDDIEAAERQEQELEDQEPPSPPRPGRRPGVRTRQPDPTSRVTRSQSNRGNQQPRPSSSNSNQSEPLRSRSPAADPASRQRRHHDNFHNFDDPYETPAAESNPAAPLRNPAHSVASGGSNRAAPEPFFLVPGPDAPVPPDANLPVDPALPDDRETIVVNDDFLNAHHSSAAEQRAAASDQGGAKRKTLSFSKPKPGNFSYRRRKPDISALRQILSSLNN